MPTNSPSPLRPERWLLSNKTTVLGYAPSLHEALVNAAAHVLKGAKVIVIWDMRGKATPELEIRPATISINGEPLNAGQGLRPRAPEQPG